jgi:hypothetical protein
MSRSLITQALERFKLADEAERDQRERELDDLTFDAGEQWPADVKAARSGQVVNGIKVAPRPMLTIPKIDQPVQLIVNQAKSAQLGVHIHPKDENATEETAKVLEDIYRTIQATGTARAARMWAFERAVKCGRGFYRVLTEYANDGDQDLDVVLKRILNQHSVYLDPFGTEPDWSDGEWAFVVEQMSYTRYTRLYPQSALAGLPSDELTGLGDEMPGWVTGDGEGHSVRIAEYWRVEGDERQRKVLWSKINAVEELDGREWEGRFIPIIPVFGREKNVNGQRRYDGMIGGAKDAGRLFNYAISVAVETAALEPRAPFIGAEGQFEGHAQTWAQANVRNFPFLEYKPTTHGGQLVPPPARNVVGANLTAALQLAQMADEAIKAATFVFDPSLGAQSDRDRSGKAIQALQQQGDMGNSNYLTDFADVSLGYEAKVVLDLIGKVYTRKGRIARLRGADDSHRAVVLNQPFTLDDQKTPVPVDQSAGPPQGRPVKEYDLTKGLYTVTPTVGKSWQTRLQQGAEEIGQVLQAQPSLLQLIGDIYFKFRDFPGHTEISERLRKLVPPQVLENEHGEPDPQQLKQELERMGQMIDLLTKELNAKNDLIEKEQLRIEAEREQTVIEAASREDIERIRSETKLAIEQMKADLAQATAIFTASVARVGTADAQAYEAAQAEVDRQHARDGHDLDLQAERERRNTEQAHDGDARA